MARLPVQTIRVDMGSANVTTSYSALDSALNANSTELEVFNPSAEALILAVGPSSGESAFLTVPPGGTPGIVPVPLCEGQKLSVKSAGSTVSSGTLIVNLYY